MPKNIYDVALIAGSKSDEKIYSKAVEILKNNNVRFDLQIISAHRNPEQLDDYIKNSSAKIFICVAGLSAALPGVVASKTKKPVTNKAIKKKVKNLSFINLQHI